MYISFLKGLGSSWCDYKSLMFFTQTKVHHGQNNDMSRNLQVYIKIFILVGSLV